MTVQTEGSRVVQRKITLYNLDAILAVGYRVRTPRGVQFRRWASTIQKEYLLKGLAMDDERLKNPDGHVNDLDEDGQVEFKAKAFTRTYDFLASVIPYTNRE